MDNREELAIVQAWLDGAVANLMIKTNVEGVYIDDTTTLASKLAEMIAAINLRAKSADVTAEIQAAVDEVVGGAPEMYDTLKEVSDYIHSNIDVLSVLSGKVDTKADKNEVDSYISSNDAAVTTLNEQMEQKADKTEVSSLTERVDALGSLSTKNVVTEEELDDQLKTKVNTVFAGTHGHDNKFVLDEITEDTIATWNNHGKTYVDETQPANLTTNDLWFQVIK